MRAIAKKDPTVLQLLGKGSHAQLVIPAPGVLRRRESPNDVGYMRSTDQRITNLAIPNAEKLGIPEIVLRDMQNGIIVGLGKRLRKHIQANDADLNAGKAVELIDSATGEVVITRTGRGYKATLTDLATGDSSVLLLKGKKFARVESEVITRELTRVDSVASELFKLVQKSIQRLQPASGAFKLSRPTNQQPGSLIRYDLRVSLPIELPGTIRKADRSGESQFFKNAMTKLGKKLRADDELQTAIARHSVLFLNSVMTDPPTGANKNCIQDLEVSFNAKDHKPLAISFGLVPAKQ